MDHRKQALKKVIEHNKKVLKPFGKYSGDTDSIKYTGRVAKEQKKDFNFDKNTAGPVGKSIRRKIRSITIRPSKYLD